MRKDVSLQDLLDFRKVNHCVKSRHKRYAAGKRDFYPWSVEVHPTTKCNFGCSYCAYKGRNAKDQSIPEDVLKSLWDALHINKTKGVFFAGGGEPLLYTGIQDHIVYLNRLGIEVALLTNGSLITNEKFAEMISCLNYVAISIPTLDEREFREITGRKMPDHIPDIANLLRANRRKAPIVGARLVAMNQNYKSLVDTVLKLKSRGYDYCIVKIPKDPEGRGLGLGDEELAYIRSEFSDKGNDLDEGFTNLGAVLEKGQAARSRGEVCWSLEYAVNCFIHTDGGVYLCLPLVGQKEFCVGNVKDENFDDIWRGTRRQEVIALMQKKYKMLECSACRNISYNNVVENYPDSGFSKNVDPFL